jgi:hypothetical protein
LRSAVITIRLLLKRARLDRALNDTLISPRQSSEITATLKRQTLKKNRTIQEKCRESRCHPGSFLVLARD